MPSWAMFVRHAKNFTVHDVQFHLLAPDARPAVMFDDVVGARLRDIRLPEAATDAGKAWRLRATAEVVARGVSGLPEGVVAIAEPRAAGR
jgi:hypothetical protein